jgi:preprotein translocase subunit SecA
VVDGSWKDHLLALDHLKEGIGLRGYGQRDPKNEYKRESFELLQAMKERVEDTVLKTLFRVEPVSVEQLAQQRRVRPPQPAPSRLDFSAPAKAAGPPRPVAVVREGEKIGRNDPCPCGSGKKYKKCHGRTQVVT